MSESNNNIPMRITQLEEATAYEDGMYYAVASASGGTKKVSTEKPSKALEPIFLNELNKIDEVSGSNAYYTNVDLKQGVCYAVKFTANTSGTYTLKAGTAGSSSAMVDTLGTFTVIANTPILINWYYPSVDVIRFRVDSNTIDYTFEIYELYDNTDLPSLPNIKTLVENVAEEVTKDNNLYNPEDPDIQTGGIILSTGVWYEASGYFETGYIPISGNGQTIYFSAASTSHVNWYNSSKERINGGTSTQEDASTQKITISSANATYLRIGLSTSYLTTAYVGLTKTHTITTSYLIKESAIPEIDSGAQWKNKKWYAFGTSITDGTSINQETGEVVGKYASILAEMSGMNLVNRGVAGGTFVNQVLNAVLNTDVSDADLITIEGCVNDFAVGSDIGEYGDYTSSTISGAMYLMAKKCCENSNALVVFITDSTGKLYTSQQTGVASDLRFIYKKGNGKTQADYNDAIKRFAEYMGLPCIDAGAKSSIDFFHPQYIADQIHHTNLGGEQYAKTIWEELKNLKPLAE